MVSTESDADHVGKTYDIQSQYIALTYDHEGKSIFQGWVGKLTQPFLFWRWENTKGNLPCRCEAKVPKKL